MVKFKFPNLKSFIYIFLLNVFLLILSFFIYRHEKRREFISDQKEKLSMISMEISSKISGMKQLTSRLSKIDFIKDYPESGKDTGNRDIYLQIESMKKSIGASVVFLMDLNGNVIMSSTYVKNRVLSGNNAKRPYFKESKKGVVSFYGAVGNQTGTRGLYFSSPVKKNGKIKSVFAVKFTMEEFDDIFNRLSGISGLVTPGGVIFSCGRKDWIFKSIFRLDKERIRSINDSGQFAKRKLKGAVFGRKGKNPVLKGRLYSLVFDRSVPGGWIVFSIKEFDKVPFPYILIPVFFIIFLFQVLFYAFIYNLKKKVEAQKQYNRSSERFRYLFQSALDLIIILNEKGIITDINYAGLLKLGFSKNELTGKHFKRIVDKRYYKIIDKHVMIISSDLSTRFEFRAVTRDGTKVLLDCSAIRLNEESLSSVTYFAFCHDITKQKKIEKDLKKAIRSAKKANNAKSEFLANMSHEIRTPMNAILGFTELLSNSRLTREQKNYLEIVMESGRSLLHIIDDILDFSRIEAGKINFETVDIDIRKTANDVVNIINIGMNKGRIKIFELIDENIPPIIKGDPLRLKQILMNLLSNAVKFTKRGEVKLEIKLHRDMDNWVALYFGVSDTGIGISEKDHDKLFKPFSQIQSSSSKKYGGTGLGLVITSGLVKQMGGEIKVKSRKGKGSLFYFILSFEKATENSKRKISYKTSGKLKWEIDPAQYKILVVEDQKVNSMLLDYILKKEGFETTIAENGKEAIKLVQKEKFDLILMDIRMPEMDGIEATTIIKKMRNGKCPIIALTADVIRGDRKKIIKIGMEDYLEKPVGRKVLLQTLKRWLEKKKQAHNLRDKSN